MPHAPDHRSAIDPAAARLGAIVDATPAARPAAVTLEGRWVRIEKLDPMRHSAALWEAVRGDDTLWDYMAYGPFADADAFTRWLSERAALADPFYYAVVDKATDKAVGILTLMEVRPASRVIEVGHIVYAPALQRTPAGTEAQYLLARYVFDDLGYRRYEWKGNALNAPSMQAAARFGFTYEGTFRQHMIIKGRNRDTFWCAMTDGDWPAVKAAFERWLVPENFDAKGQQKARLADMRAKGP